MVGECRDGDGRLVADTFCNGIKKRFPSYFFPSFFFFAISIHGVSFLLLFFSPSSLGHARRELGLSFLPSFLFSFLNGFGSVVYYLILGERGRGK